MAKGFINDLTQQQISDQISCDWSCIYQEIIGERRYNKVGKSIGRIVGVKMIEKNRDECDHDHNEGIFGASVAAGECLEQCEECANVLGIELPTASSEEPNGSIASVLMMRIIARIAENAGLPDEVIALIKALL